jgi:hypothetical protein
MSRRAFIVALLAAQASLWGCSGPQGPNGKFSVPNRKFSRAELEKHIADKLKLHDVTLVDQGGGRFTGTGKNAEGNVVDVEVTQEERRRTWKSTYKGPKGVTENFGNEVW